MIMLFNYIFALISLIGSSISDVKTREVPDILSVGSIFLGFVSVITAFIIVKDWRMFFDYILGFIVALSFALIMYHTRQWGGGDTKLLIGFGILFGLTKNNYFFLNLILLIMIIGAIYGINWTLFISLKSIQPVLNEFKRVLHQPFFKGFRKYSVFFILLLLIIMIFVEIRFKIFFALTIFFYYLVLLMFVYIKAVEKVVLIKKIPIKDVTEGDWIAEAVIVNKKIICGPKDKGITNSQIALLKKSNIKTIKVKYGIPFVPVFLISFLINCYLIFIQNINIVEIIFRAIV